MAKITFSMGGVHPNDAKIAKDRAIEVLPLPQTVYVSMAQHLGAPAKPVVAVGDKSRPARSSPNRADSSPRSSIPRCPVP